MTVPGRVEAASLLLSLDPPAWLLRHSRAVAEVAGWLAARTAARGIAVDRRLIESAALLHDVDKALPAGHPLRGLPHGEGSAAWLLERGYGELVRAVAAHPVTRLRHGGPFERPDADAPHEVRIVAYADKRAGQRLEAMADRFASWHRRFPPEATAGAGTWDEATFESVRRTADHLEAGVCRAAGVAPADVGRLRWTGAALRSAAGRQGARGIR